MIAPLIRILVLGALVFGAYKVYPRFSPEIRQITEHPEVLGEHTAPIIESINEILPSNLQIPTKIANTANNADAPNPTQNVSQEVIDSIKGKATDLAGEQIEILKQEAGKQFCSVLLEKIKTECQ